MSKQQNHNLFYLEGDQTTNDMDVCETLGIDPKYAFTPEINEQAIRKMYEENMRGYAEQGLDPTTAASLAGDLAKEARERVKKASKAK